MITARIQFLQNSLITDLSQLPIHLRGELQSMGILTPQDMIRLDNSRTLKIELYSEDNYGERLLDLVNKNTDTLGEVNRLCYSIRCMDMRDRIKFFHNIDNEKYNTLSEAQSDINALRSQRQKKGREYNR